MLIWLCKCIACVHIHFQCCWFFFLLFLKRDDAAAFGCGLLCVQMWWKFAVRTTNRIDFFVHITRHTSPKSVRKSWPNSFGLTNYRFFVQHENMRRVNTTFSVCFFFSSKIRTLHEITTVSHWCSSRKCVLPLKLIWMCRDHRWTGHTFPLTMP